MTELFADVHFHGCPVPPNTEDGHCDFATHPFGNEVLPPHERESRMSIPKDFLCQHKAKKTCYELCHTLSNTTGPATVGGRVADVSVEETRSCHRRRQSRKCQCRRLQYLWIPLGSSLDLF